jgi:hypothetical protein
MSQLFQHHERRVEEQRPQHGGGQWHGQPRPQQSPKPQPKPMRIIKPECKIDLQPAIDWFARLLCLGTWGGLAALIAYLWYCG